MLLQLKPLFMGERDTLPVETTLDLSALDFQGRHPFPQPVQVHGAARQSADVVTLELTVEYRFDGVCDRCAEPYQRQGTLAVRHVLVTSLSDEENEDFVLLRDYQLPLDERVQEDLLLELPMKNLCRKDCRGLCPICGKNLNDGLCGCRRETGDPRLAALRDLLS